MKNEETKIVELNTNDKTQPHAPGTHMSKDALSPLEAEREKVKALEQYIAQTTKLHRDEIASTQDFFAQKNPSFKRFSDENKALRNRQKEIEKQMSETVQTFRENIGSISITVPNRFKDVAIHIMNNNGIADLRDKQFKDKRATSTGIFASIALKDKVTKLRIRLVGHPSDIANAAYNVGMQVTEKVFENMIVEESETVFENVPSDLPEQLAVVKNMLGKFESDKDESELIVFRGEKIRVADVEDVSDVEGPIIADDERIFWFNVRSKGSAQKNIFEFEFNEKALAEKYRTHFLNELEAKRN